MQVRDRDATAIENGLVIALIAMVVVAGVAALGLAAQSIFQSSVDNWP